MIHCYAGLVGSLSVMLKARFSHLLTALTVGQPLQSMKKARVHPRLSSSCVVCLSLKVGDGPDPGNVAFGCDFCIRTSHNRGAGSHNREGLRWKGCWETSLFCLTNALSNTFCPHSAEGFSITSSIPHSSGKSSYRVHLQSILASCSGSLTPNLTALFQSLHAPSISPNNALGMPRF